MFVSSILDKIIDIKFINNLYPPTRTKKDYKKALISDYKLISKEPLLIQGNINLFTDKKETFSVSIPDKTYNYLIYISYSHNDTWKLIELKSIEEVESFILKPGGFLNSFISDLIVLENLKHKSYKVFEVLPNGYKKEIVDFDECTKDIEPNLMVQWY